MRELVVCFSIDADRVPAKHLIMKKLLLACAFLCAASTAAAKQPSLLDEFTRALQAHTDRAPATALIETGFSPDGDAERLVLKVINASQKSIRLAAYSFTSPKVVRALMEAKKRGVDVRVVVDEKGNQSKSGTAALNLLTGARIPVRTNGEYAIHHDKYIVADNLHVQTGSFNYSRAAAGSNSENVIVIWHNAELAASYLRHWQSRYAQGKEVKAGY
jgi:phosphatidylserine/phosphatidylglycerophosphate/cardiolipin synthase-like enzyme